jgi:hypothetical protein
MSAFSRNSALTWRGAKRGNPQTSIRTAGFILVMGGLYIFGQTFEVHMAHDSTYLLPYRFPDTPFPAISHIPTLGIP